MIEQQRDDDLLEGTEAVTDLPPTFRQERIIPPEPGERVDRPWRYGDPLELPSDGRERTVSTQGFGRDPIEAARRLRAVPRTNGEPIAPAAAPPDPSPEEERLAHLRWLRRWACPIAHSQTKVDQIISLIEGIEQHPDKAKRKVPPRYRAELEVWRGKLATALEYETIKATRPDGCDCLGTGGWDGEVYLAIHDPDAPQDPQLPPVILYSEGLDSPKTWSRTCSACPEGQAHLAWRADQIVQMRQRWATVKLRRLLGDNSHIPQRFMHLNLSTYPYQEVAQRAWRWLSTNLSDREKRRLDPMHPPSLRPFLLMSAPNRRGKSGLAIGLMMISLERGHDAIFKTLPDLLASIKAGFDPITKSVPDAALEAYRNVSLLVIDDLGAEKTSDWVEETLYRLLDSRAIELKLTVFTTNLGIVRDPVTKLSPLQAWVGQRIYSRIHPYANPLLFEDVPALNYDDDDEHPPLESNMDLYTEW